jgi:hypothetical protein
MAGDSLARLREQADASGLDVKAAALLHIARVEAAINANLAKRTLSAGIEAAAQIAVSRDAHFLFWAFRQLIAAVDPSRIEEINSFV